MEKKRGFSKTKTRTNGEFFMKRNNSRKSIKRNTVKTKELKENKQEKLDMLEQMQKRAEKMLKRVNALNRDLGKILGDKFIESESEEENNMQKVIIKKEEIQQMKEADEMNLGLQVKIERKSSSKKINLHEELENFELMKEETQNIYSPKKIQKSCKSKKSEQENNQKIIGSLPFDSKDLSNGSQLFLNMQQSKYSEKSKEDESLFLFKNLEDKITSQVFNTKENNKNNGKLTSDDIVNQFSQRSDKDSDHRNIVGETNNVLRALLFKHKI
jgi:hypothetical protein